MCILSRRAIGGFLLCAAILIALELAIESYTRMVAS